MLKKIIDRIIGGMGIAFIITNITMFIFVRDQSGLNTIYAYIVWMVAGMLYGVSSLIHEIPINRWLSSLIGFAAMLTISYSAITIMFYGVFKINPGFNFLWLIPVFTFIFICVSISTFVYEKIAVRSLNKKLQNDNE